MPRYAGIGRSVDEGGKRRTGGGRIGSNYGTGRGLTGKSRTQERISNKLGLIAGSGRAGAQKVRCEELDKYDKYLCSEQYDSKMPWDAGSAEEYIPIRARKPRVIYNLGKRIVDTVATKLVGDAVFPRLAVEDDPDTEQFVQVLSKTATLPMHVLYAIKKALGCGSSFLRFYVVGATIRMETYSSKYCYPVFSEEGQLESVEIRYVYEDEDDLDAKGDPTEKWFRMVLTTSTDVLYDNPLFVAGAPMPEFEEVGRADHMMGFVQGTWFRTGFDKHSPDGPSLLCDVLDLIDAINYSLSQADQASTYAQEPQLAISGMDIDEIDDFIKSSQKAWNLGRDGKAEFVEADLAGIEKAAELRGEFKQNVSDIARIVMLDPEKIVGSAQSAKAMEVLHGPLVELVSELRAFMAPLIVELTTKMAAAVLTLEQQGLNEVITMPKGFVPKSLTLNAVWPPIFPMTMEDLQKKCMVGVSVSNANLVSRESITRWIASDFGIEDIEAEVQKVNTQPQLNPYGAF